MLGAMGPRVALALATTGVFSVALGARAELPRDYFLDAPAAGVFSHSDLYNVGLQQSLEHRMHLEEGMSMLHTRLSGVVSYPYAEGSLNLDVRVFLVTLGGSAGYRQVYRNHTFEPGEDASRDRRNEREKAGEHDSQGYAFGEGRLRMVVPLDPFFLVTTGTLRWEGVDDNSFDWFHANMHDSGTLGKVDGTLFWRNPSFGGIGPYLRFMSVQKTKDDGSHEREGELHYGLTFGTRPGLVTPRGRRSDLLLVQLITKLGDEEFGLHPYRLPLYPLIVYRATLTLI